MAEYTTNFNLEKQQGNEYVSIEGLNVNFDIIDAELKETQEKAEQAFQQASNGKVAIKNAITGLDPSVEIPTDATFQELANAIGQIETGINTDDATATAEQILVGITAYIKGVKVTGSMTNRGAVNQALSINGTYTIPIGYHNGSGKVSQSITTKGAATIIPNTTDQTIVANQYLTGIQTIKGDANLISSNILQGKSIFGVVGNVVAGKRYATGYMDSLNGDSITFMNNQTTLNGRFAVVSGVNFTARTVRVRFTLDTNGLYYYYINGFHNMQAFIYAEVTGSGSYHGYALAPYGTTRKCCTITSSGFEIAVPSGATRITWEAWE